jgi:flagellar hook-length control protein FliK
VQDAEGVSKTRDLHSADVAPKAADTETQPAQLPVSRGVEREKTPPEAPVPDGVRGASDSGLDMRSAEVRSTEVRSVEVRPVDARSAEARSVEGRAHVPVQALPATLVTLAQAVPDGPVTVTLSPEDLGALRFEMHGKGDAVHIALTVERPETLDMLRRNAEQLIGEFRQAGFAAASFSFSGAWSGGREQASQRPQYRADETEAEGPIRAMRKQVGSGLDLRI